MTANTLTDIIGHQFPGGEYLIEHWENFLLTDCTGGSLMANGVVHPIALFHMPIIGAGTSIAEMFALGNAESDFSISIESYDWTFHSPLQENVSYQVIGEVKDAVEGVSENGRDYDLITFRFELRTNAELIAATEVAWRYNRSNRSGL